MATQIMNRVAVTGNNNYYSSAFGMQVDSNFAIQVSWTGDPTGVLKLQFSCIDNPGDSDWVTDTVAEFPANPAGSASATLEHWSGAGAKWVRLWYDGTSGTGTMSAWIHTKDD